MIPDSRHLLHIRGLSVETLQTYLSLSQKIKQDPSKYTQVLKGKSVLQFFIENSTRTRMSFDTAIRKLGGGIISFSPGISSLNKGETIIDTIQTIKQYGMDMVAIRHSSSGAPALVASVLDVPVVNAGDGQHEHPTQALLDCFTLLEHWKINPTQANPFKDKTIVIVGDIFHSRVARSNIHAMTTLGARVVLCAPQTFLPSDLSLFPKVDVEYKLDRILPHADAVMCLRIQFERQNDRQIPSKQEYRHFWGMTAERKHALKSGAVVMHPGPVNRGLEIDPEIADSSQSLILKQVENGVWTRMAVLATLGSEGALS
jgi:aspartate carbamoyltransferase catalytic subunit